MDIVERLRGFSDSVVYHLPLLNEAAEEIERLRHELELMKREKERLMWDRRDQDVRKRLGIVS